MNTINIALTFNNNYCQLAAGALESIVRNTTPAHQYKISVIHDDITEQNQHFLKKICNKNNILIGFITFNPREEAGKELFIRFHYTHEMYSRLFLHRIFPDIDRILYTDVDVIVNSDLAELYKTDLGKYPIAALRGNAGFRSFEYQSMFSKEDLIEVKMPKNTVFSQYQNLYKYQTEYLKIPEDELHTYFNSGTMVIDLKQYGEIIDRGLDEIIGNAYVTPDQDMLNILFRNNALILDQSYSVHPNKLHEYISIFGKLPDIIHYSGSLKPNKSMSRPGDKEYWKSIYNTEYYYPVLEGFIESKIQNKSNQFNRLLSDQRTLDDLFHNLRRIKRLNMRRKFIRMIIKMLVDGKKYKKLKQNPERFFEDSKSNFIRYLKKFYF